MNSQKLNNGQKNCVVPWVIKIQNIYHMLAYAFQVLRKDSYAKIATEEFANVCDLLAAILAKGLASQVKRGLGKEYVSRTETLGSPFFPLEQVFFTREKHLLVADLIFDNSPDVVARFPGIKVIMDRPCNKDAAGHRIYDNNWQDFYALVEGLWDAGRTPATKPCP